MVRCSSRPRNEGAQVLLDAVTGGLNGGAQPTQDGVPSIPQWNSRRITRGGAFSPMRLISPLGVSASVMTGGRRRGLLRRVAGEDGLDERLRHRPKARLIRGGERVAAFAFASAAAAARQARARREQAA